MAVKNRLRKGLEWIAGSKHGLKKAEVVKPGASSEDELLAPNQKVAVVDDSITYASHITAVL